LVEHRLALEFLLGLNLGGLGLLELRGALIDGGLVVGRGIDLKEQVAFFTG
jgi:hypothetical protein